MKRLFFIGLAVIALYFAPKLYADYNNDRDNLGCKRSWNKCTDESDFIAHGDLVHVQTLCKIYADEHLPNGKPDWPNGLIEPPFSKYVHSETFKSDGFISLGETGILVPNEYGGKERERFLCRFNLKEDRVASFDHIPESP